MLNKTKLLIGAAIGIVGILIVVVVILVSRNSGGGGGGGTTNTCGNGHCDNGETVKTCPQDCGGTAGTTTRLVIWGVFDDSDVYQPIIDKYKALNKNVEISYVKKDSTTYEKDVVDAFASGQGPDIWQIHNDWLPQHRLKIAPAPATFMTLDDYKKTFVPAAYDDLVYGGKIYGVPLYVDNLAMFYNQTLFGQAKIEAPPQNWNDFLTDSEKITQIDAADRVTTAGAVMGTSNNIQRPMDILYALMMQNMQGKMGMTNEVNTEATFNQSMTVGAQAYYPGTKALEFYTSFAKPAKETYTWNSTFPDGLSVFAQGKAGMMFGYSYMVPQIVKKNPSLNFGVVPIPQIKGADVTLTVADYWPLVVAANSKNTDAAWNFLKYASSKEGVTDYYGITKNPPSRYDIESLSLNDEKSVAFKDQAKISHSWYKGDPTAVDKLFADAITSVVLYNQPAQAALDTTARLVSDKLKASQ